MLSITQNCAEWTVWVTLVSHEMSSEFCHEELTFWDIFYFRRSFFLPRFRYDLTGRQELFRFIFGPRPMGPYGPMGPYPRQGVQGLYYEFSSDWAHINILIIQLDHRAYYNLVNINISIIIETMLTEHRLKLFIVQTHITITYHKIL